MFVICTSKVRNSWSAELSARFFSFLLLRHIKFEMISFVALFKKKGKKIVRTWFDGTRGVYYGLFTCFLQGLLSVPRAQKIDREKMWSTGTSKTKGDLKVPDFNRPNGYAQYCTAERDNTISSLYDVVTWLFSRGISGNFSLSNYYSYYYIIFYDIVWIDFVMPYGPDISNLKEIISITCPFNPWQCRLNM